MDDQNYRSMNVEIAALCCWFLMDVHIVSQPFWAYLQVWENQSDAAVPAFWKTL